MLNIVRGDYPTWWQEWNGIRPWWPWLLLPLMGLYIVASWLRQKCIKPTKVNIPVVCVGNIAIGGVGKTPIIMHLATVLQDKGIKVHVIGHGYGVNISKPYQVDAKNDRANFVGDEALIVARICPVWIGGNRLERATEAENAGAELLLMDDGWQDPILHKDKTIAVVNGRYPWGNGYRLPLGPLRVSQNMLFRARVIAVYDQPQAEVRKNFPEHLKISVYRESHWQGAPPMSDKVIIFCGIGRGEQFFSQAEQLCHKAGKTVCLTKKFSDHYLYKETDLQILQNKYPEAELITTEKDWVRLPKNWQDRVLVVSLALKGVDNKDYLNLVQEIHALSLG